MLEASIQLSVKHGPQNIFLHLTRGCHFYLGMLYLSLEGWVIHKMHKEGKESLDRREMEMWKGWDEGTEGVGAEGVREALPGLEPAYSTLLNSRLLAVTYWEERSWRRWSPTTGSPVGGKNWGSPEFPLPTGAGVSGIGSCTGRPQKNLLQMEVW